MNIYYGGGEVKKHLNILRGNGAEYLIMPYEALEGGSDVDFAKRVMVYAPRGKKDVDGYIKDYTRFIIMNFDKYDYFLEPDIYMDVSPKDRLRVLDVLSDISDKIVPLFNSEKMSFKFLDDVLRKFDMIASVGRDSQIHRALINKKVKMFGKEVHYLWFNSWKALMEKTYAIPDSISTMGHLSGNRYGTTILFKNNEMSVFNNKANRVSYTRYAEKLGINVEKWLSEDYDEVVKFNLKNIQKFGDYINWKYRGVHSEFERR